MNQRTKPHSRRRASEDSGTRRDLPAETRGVEGTRQRGHQGSFCGLENRPSASFRGSSTFVRPRGQRHAVDQPHTRVGYPCHSSRLPQPFGQSSVPSDRAKSKVNKRYIPALDGLRALAVIAVIAYHLGADWARGGLLGVTVFFVLSGYLITGLLVNEVRETGAIDLIHFWVRRVRRLFPAIFTLIVTVAALCVLFNHPLLTKMRPDIVPCLFWFQNWWYVFRGMSYFDNLGDPSPLTHFWSLAIEEQFYVIWPLVLLAIFKIGGRRKALRTVCLALAAASALLMALLYNPNSDPTRVYYGTDTRAFSLLIGAWLALAWPGNQLSLDHMAGVAPRAVRLLDIVGGVGLAGVIAMMVLADGTAPFMYRGGILLASIFSAIAMAALVHPLSRLAAVFSTRPLVWVGTRSYGMYLWHYPLILLLKPLDPASAQGGYSWWFFVLIFALTFAVAELSYRFVENPIRHGAIGRFVGRVRESGLGAELRRTANRTSVAMTVTCLALVLFAGIGCALVPDAASVPREAIQSTGVSAGAAMKVDTDTRLGDSAGTPADTTSPHAASGILQHEKGKVNPLLIGDSIPGDAKSEFDGYFSYGLLDAYVGRWFWQARDVYRDYKNQGVVGHVVIFANFSNHALQSGELAKMRKLVGPDHEIFLVNVKTPKKLESENNEKLAAFAQEHENVHLVDWNSLACSHMDEYLWGDNEHLKEPDGCRAYMRLIFDAVSPYLPEKDIAKKYRSAQGELSTGEATRLGITGTSKVPSVAGAAP